MYSYGPLHIAGQKQDDQLEHTYSNYVMIRDVALKTCLRRWMIGRSGERGLGISVLVARYDDDDDDDDDDDVSVSRRRSLFKFVSPFQIVQIKVRAIHPIDGEICQFIPSLKVLVRKYTYQCD